MRAVMATAIATLVQAENPISACPGLTPRAAPSNIKDLKPADVRVVAAMGDSFTAGFAIHGVPEEARDESYVTGTKANATTIVNFFKHYGSNVASHNIAVSGDVVQGMDKQATRVISAIKGDSSIDFEKDWKLVTILIGGNNQGAACFGQEANLPPVYKEDLTSAIEILSTGLPRALINLVPMVNLSSLATAPGTDSHCVLQHIIGKAECPCPFKSDAARSTVQNVTVADNAEMYQIAKGYHRDDFATVVQPAIEMMDVPDWTYLSRFDCFHPSLKTHQQVALALWENLFQPVGKKAITPQLPVSMYCPTDDDLIFSAPSTEQSVVV